MKFVDFWKDTTGQDPQWLCFDSKVTKVSELSHLNQRKIKFVTIRQRNQSELRRLQNLPAESWTKASIEKPKRTYTKISLVDEKISLKGYSGEIRQIAVSGLGRKNSTLFLTNDTQETPQQIIIRYTERNHIEGAIGSCVDFFTLTGCQAKWGWMLIWTPPWTSLPAVVTVGWVLNFVVYQWPLQRHYVAIL